MLSLTTMQMDDAAYPFLAFSGIPSVSFSFVSKVSVVFNVLLVCQFNNNIFYELINELLMTLP